MDHTIEFEEDTGILLCRMSRFLDEATARAFGIALHDRMAAVRSRMPALRILIDNRNGRVAAPAAAGELIEKMRSAKLPGDRTTIIVPDSLGKLQAKRITTTQQEVFMSENAARIWLLAYDG